MSEPTLIFFCAALTAIAALYASVGQAGASGYIAVMALFGFPSIVVKPTALVLNLAVSAVVTIVFSRAGYFPWKSLLPFTLPSVPAAALGGFITLPPVLFARLLGSLLAVAAFPLLLRDVRPQGPITEPRLGTSIAAGAIIGFLSGLTGVGGGVLITPLLLYRRWAEARPAAAVSAMFILVNTASALLGHLSGARSLPPNLLLFASCVVVGGIAGSRLGAHHISPAVFRRLLGIILLTSGMKLIFA